MDGILGASFLIRYAITLDYAQRELTLRPYSGRQRTELVRQYNAQTRQL